MPTNMPTDWRSLVRMTYNPKRLAKLGSAHIEARATYEAARDAMLPEVESALRAKVKQVEIVKLTGLTRERIRQIGKELGIEQ